MKSFNIQKILIPIDFSETAMQAIEHAAFTAQVFKADLVLLHVVERHWERFNIIAPEMRVQEPDNLINKIETKLEDIAREIRSKYGVKSVCVTSDGNIFSEIIAVSSEHKVDLILMGTHGTSGWVEFFVGSNTYKVVTESEGPVLSVARHASRLGFSEILLPIDNSAHSRQKVNYGVILAKQFAAKIHILGLDDTEDASERRTLEHKLDQVEEYVKKCGVVCSKHVEKGTNQSKMTQQYAEKINADLIVIMTDQDENLTGRLMGGYAQQIVNHSKIPVLTIKPKVGYIEFPSLGGGYHAPEP